MRDRYRPETPNPEHFVRSATVVPDANVLLGLYRLSPGARADALRALEAVSSRLWLPHQVGLEFYRNLDAVRDGLASAYAATRTAVARAAKSWQEFGSGRRYEDSREALKALIESTVEELLTKIDGLRAADRAIVPAGDDDVLSTIEALFQDRLGPEPSEALVEQRVEHFMTYRAPNRIPPGYEDLQRKQLPLLAAGDYLLWCEVLDFAEQQGGALLLLTDDTKDDWYQRVHGKSDGPRPELVLEFARRSPGGYHQMTLSRFVELAQRVLDTAVAKGSVDEIERIEQDSARESQPETALEQALAASANPYWNAIPGNQASLSLINEALAQARPVSDAYRLALLADLNFPRMNLSALEFVAGILAADASRHPSPAAHAEDGSAETQEEGRTEVTDDPVHRDEGSQEDEEPRGS